MTILVSLLLAWAVLAYVAFPLFRHPKEEREEGEQAELEARRDSLYSAIKELHYDYELGNLSPEEHRELEEKYKARAVAVLQELDRSTPSPQEEIERETQALRQEMKGRLFCTRCGTPAQAGDSFCSRCGASLRRPSP